MKNVKRKITGLLAALTVAGALVAGSVGNDGIIWVGDADIGNPDGTIWAGDADIGNPDGTIWAG